MRQPAAPRRGRTPSAAREARTAARLREHGRTALIAVTAGLFMAAVGAFGTGEAGLARRTAYWVGVILAGASLSAVIGGLVRGRGWLEEQPWLQGGLVTLLLAPPLTVVVWWVTQLAFGPGAGFDTLWGFLPPVLGISAVMATITELAQRRPIETHAAGPGAPEPRFLERLPFKLRGAALYAVEAEDHYLRLHTDRGSDLILMRLSDAVAELEGLEGAQTHRSWWVAKAAVAEAQRGDGRAVLKLKNGVEAPVSRTYAKALREAGWF